MSARRRLAGVLAVLVLLVAGVGYRFGGTAVFAVELAAPASERWLAWAGREPAREEVEIVTARGRLVADLYRPAAPRQALVLVHGLSRDGRRHPELVRLARLLGRQGQLVLVPHFDGLAAFRLGGDEVEQIRAALHHLRSSGRPVGIAGFSFGAGPALVAAAETPGLSVVASFGGYADLRHVVRFITTGVHEGDGRRHVAPHEPYNRWKLLSLLVGFVEDARDRRVLHALAETRLANPAQATEGLESDLGAEGRAMLALVRNASEEELPRLLARLPAAVHEALDRLSAVAAAPRLTARLLIAHGVGDTSIPFTESLRLASAAQGRARVVILRTFHHTGPEPLWRALADRARDGWHLLALLDDLLGR